MDDLDFQNTPNPFSAFAQSQQQSRRSLRSAAKLLGISLVLFAILVTGQETWKRLRVESWTTSFPRKSVDEKLDMIDRLRAAGLPGIRGLVLAVSDPDPEVAKKAYHAVESMRQEWTTQPAADVRRRRLELARCLAEAVPAENASPGGKPRADDAQSARPDHVPNAWIRQLADAVAADSSTGGFEASDDATTEKMRIAVEEMMNANTTSTSETSMDSQPRDPHSIPRDAVELTQNAWTDWPPTEIESATPKLYQPEVSRIDVTDEPQNIHAQVKSTADSNAGIKLLKPRIATAQTLAEIKSSPETSAFTDQPDSNREHWIAQLRSPSRLVRLRAITELRAAVEQGTDPDAATVRALKDQLAEESDSTVADRLQQTLSHWRVSM
jgi:hypothetical protein